MNRFYAHGGFRLTMIPLQRFPTLALTKRPTLLQACLPYTALVSARTVGNFKTRRSDSGVVYSFVAPLETNTGSTLRRNLWKVWRDGNHETELIAKGPSRDDDRTQGCPAFQHEVKMQRLFNKDKMIRPMVNFIPSSDVDDEPMMVLNPFEQTLWDARNARPMTTAEIKWIMEGVMLGLQTIHRRGLVHTGLFSNSIFLFHKFGNGYLADLEQTSRWRTSVLLGSTTKSPTSIRRR